MEPVFADVQDSPLWRLRVAELESSADALKARTKKLVAGGRSFSDSLEDTFQSKLQFAECLEEFCGGADEESAAIGGPTLLRFVHVLRELSSFTELLRAQVELLVCGRLGEAAAAEASDVRKARSRLAQRSADYDAARARHLGHRRGSWPLKTTSPEKTLAAARRAADEARYDLARKLAEAQGKRRYLYVESLASIMQAHLNYFRHGLSAMQSVEPYIAAALEVTDRLKGNAAAQQAALEDVIQAQRQADEARAGSGSPEPSPPPLGPCRAVGGPLQMTAATTQLAAELGGYIRTTQDSGGSQVMVLKQGYLLKRSSKSKTKWHRRFFVLDSNGMLYYCSAKSERGSSIVSEVAGRLGREAAGRDQRPQNTVPLLTSTVKPGPPPDSPPVPFAFRLVSPEREFVLQAEDGPDASEWQDLLQSAIACLLTGVMTAEQPAIPARPTHSRTASAATNAANFSALLPTDSGPLTTGAAAVVVSSFPLIGQDSAVSSPSKLSKESSFALPSPLPSPQRPTTAAAAANPSAAAAPPTPAATPLGALRDSGTIDGNDRCADCGASSPEWASLNLGTLICIECCSSHRQLGVHNSKIRSLTLDVRVWEPPVMALFQALGNAFANEVWEGGLSYTPRAGAGADWVAHDSAWSEGSNDESAPLSSAMRRLSAGEARLTRPGLMAPSAAKERFVRAKYAERKFLRLPEADGGTPVDLVELLWEAVSQHDVRAAYYALACGADAAHEYGSSPAARLAWEANMRAGGAQEHPVSPSNLGGIGLLHAAASSGNTVVTELLLQWGSNPDACDIFGRTPLMYCLLYDCPEVAKQLLRRGASAAVRDRTGRPGVQLATGRRCGGDAELALLLSRAT